MKIMIMRMMVFSSKIKNMKGKILVLRLGLKKYDGAFCRDHIKGDYPKIMMILMTMMTALVMAT